jgi:hypothetical protein
MVFESFHQKGNQMSFLMEARESLADDLRAGKTVDGCTLRELIECDLDQNFRFASMEAASLLVMEEPDRSLCIDRYTERLIKEYLGAKEDLVREVAAGMAQDYAESQRADA